MAEIAVDASARSPGRATRISRAAVLRAEPLLLVSILGVAAVVRFANLSTRAGFDQDQGMQALGAYQAAHGQLPVFGPPAVTAGSFHHGALYYDLLAPAAWLGGGDPTWMYAEIALLGLATVAMVWWVARSMGGTASGLIAALIAAVSTALVRYSIGIWNPYLVEPGAALAILGTYQAWRSRHGAWWLGAALGVDVAAQAHLVASVIAVPVLVTYALAVKRSQNDERRRLLGWGVASAGLVLVTVLPLLAYEIGHDMAESRAIVGFLMHGGQASLEDFTSSPPDWPIFVKLPFATLRVLGWPLTGWPLVSPTAALLPAVAAAGAVVAGLISRLLAARRHRLSRAETSGLLLDTGSLAFMIPVLALGLTEVSQIQRLPTEQYHAVADPLVIVAAALVLAAVARSSAAWRGFRLGPPAVAAALVALVAWNAAWWPPLESYDGGWPAAAAAAHRIEETAEGGTIGLVGLPEAKGPDAYRYPLMLDDARLTDAANADYVVVLCDSFWVKNCRGPAEEAWRAANGGEALVLAASFDAAPDRTLTIYRRKR